MLEHRTSSHRSKVAPTRVSLRWVIGRQPEPTRKASLDREKPYVARQHDHRTLAPGAAPPDAAQSEPHIRRRRGTVVVSLLGIMPWPSRPCSRWASSAAFPDSPSRRVNFGTKRVNLSEEAFSYGRPDSPIVILMHAVTWSLPPPGAPTAPGTTPGCRCSRPRLPARSRPWPPRTSSTRCPNVDEVCCPSCIADAFAHFATLGLVPPEAVEAAEELFGRL